MIIKGNNFALLFFLNGRGQRPFSVFFFFFFGRADGACNPSADGRIDAVVGHGSVSAQLPNANRFIDYSSIIFTPGRFLIAKRFFFFYYYSVAQRG